MNIQDIAIKKLRAIYAPKGVDEKKVSVDKILKLQLQVEAMNLGFIFTDKAIVALSQNMDSYSDIFQTLSELVGANKQWKPFYKNFPTEVFEASDV